MKNKKLKYQQIVNFFRINEFVNSIFIYYLLVIYFLFLIFCFTGCNLRSNSPKKVGEVIINDQKILVEVVDTWPAIYKGLSGRESLAENQGMLFVFPKLDIYEFWMKDMKFPLDIIWIQALTDADNSKRGLTQIEMQTEADKDKSRINVNQDTDQGGYISVNLRSNLRKSVTGEIVEIWSNAPLPTENYIPRYRPKSLANYVLEVPAGTVIKYGWWPGSQVNIKY